MWSKLLFLFALFSLSTSPLQAAPELRGFQIAGSISDAELDQLRDVYHVNVARIQIGDNVLMDFRTGQGYIDMMEDAFDRLDPLLAKLSARNIKVVFALYSPPGGFETRTGPAHYRMFSDASLQTEYIDMWLRIMARYGDNSAIYAFDLLNEPALRASSLGSGARDWNTLLLDTISAIRTVAPNVTLMVKSLYGDPSKLSLLPAINDAHIIYSYHPYFFLAYQHSGIESFPTTTAAPSETRIAEKLQGFISKFYLKYYANFRRGKVPTEVPLLNAGEIAVSAAARDSGVFLNRLLAEIESTGTDKQKKSALKKIKKKFKLKQRLLAKDFVQLIAHQSWTAHAFDEAPIWDPRYECARYDDCTYSGDSSRNQVLKSFFGLN